MRQITQPGQEISKDSKDKIIEALKAKVEAQRVEIVSLRKTRDQMNDDLDAAGSRIAELEGKYECLEKAIVNTKMGLIIVLKYAHNSRVNELVKEVNKDNINLVSASSLVVQLGYLIKYYHSMCANLAEYVKEVHEAVSPVVAQYSRLLRFGKAVDVTVLTQTALDAEYKLRGLSNTANNKAGAIATKIIVDAVDDVNEDLTIIKAMAAGSDGHLGYLEEVLADWDFSYKMSLDICRKMEDQIKGLETVQSCPWELLDDAIQLRIVKGLEEFHEFEH